MHGLALGGPEVGNESSPVFVDVEPTCGELSSLCWKCQRAEWYCLCQWPYQRIAGMRTVITGYEEEGTPLEVVVYCPCFWPDN